MELNNVMMGLHDSNLLDSYLFIELYQSVLWNFIINGIMELQLELHIYEVLSFWCSVHLS